MKHLKYLGIVALAFLMVQLSWLPKETPSYKKHIRDYVASRTVALTYTDLKKFGGGTGFHVQLPHGGTAILTNGHVCALKDEHNEILVHSPVLERPMNRRIISVSNFTDLCLIEGIPGLDGLDIGNRTSPGDQISVVGHPWLMPTTMTHGEVIGESEVDVVDHLITSAQNEESCNLPKNKVLTIETFFGSLKVCCIHINAIYTTVTIFPGNSGSATIDNNGKLVGVAFAGDNSTHWGLSVTLDDVQQFLYPY